MGFGIWLFFGVILGMQAKKKERDFPFLMGRDVEIVREKKWDTGIKI